MSLLHVPFCRRLIVLIGILSSIPLRTARSRFSWCASHRDDAHVLLRMMTSLQEFPAAWIDRNGAPASMTIMSQTKTVKRFARDDMPPFSRSASL